MAELEHPDPDRPYHRQARGRPVARLGEIGLAAVFWFGFSIALHVIVMTSFHARKLAGLPPDARFASGVLLLAAMTPAAVLAAIVMKRNPGALISVYGRARWRWLGRCLVAATCLELVVLGLGFAIDAVRGTVELSIGVEWTVFLPRVLLVLLVIPLQAMGEEFMFRGTLLQATGRWVAAPWFAIAISSVLFALAHGLDVAGTFSIAGVGAIYAWMTIRTGGLEAALALHVANNLTSFVAKATVAGTDWYKLNRSWGWSSSLVHVVVCAVYAIIIVRMWRAREPATGARR
ncbi:MAG: family intrarane metalloprotease protein [Myxococcales bacterium]|nr:family intrarane metalloprotease protein [Myxococcales bacterium]